MNIRCARKVDTGGLPRAGYGYGHAFCEKADPPGYGGPAFLCNENTSKICFGVSYVAQIEGFESADSSFCQGADSERRAYF